MWVDICFFGSKSMGKSRETEVYVVGRAVSRARIFPEK
jgi:hypothetical protein